MAELEMPPFGERPPEGAPQGPWGGSGGEPGFFVVAVRLGNGHAICLAVMKPGCHLLPHPMSPPGPARGGREEARRGAEL